MMDDYSYYIQGDSLTLESPSSPHSPPSFTRSVDRSINQSDRSSCTYSTIHELDEDRVDDLSVSQFDQHDTHEQNDSHDYPMQQSVSNQAVKQTIGQTVDQTPLSPTSPSFFRYQVAGHSLLLWHAGTVCKPLIQREHDWYTHVENFLPILIPFIPKFYGVLDTDTMSESIKQELGLAPNRSLIQSNNQTTSRSPGHQSNNSCPFASSLVAKLTKSASSQSLNQSINQSVSDRYLVIEDLTFAYSQPCIMDLKVGTRQHGLEDSIDKIASKARKCANSTSSRLGLRLCGMQVYHSATQRLVHRDKYAGRALSVPGFMQTLREFFSNGRCLRFEIMGALLARLCLFRATLAQLTHYRFYSSSLLLVYEGANIDSENDSPLCHPTNRCELVSYTAASVTPLIDSLMRKDPAGLQQALASLSTCQSSCSSPSLKQSLDALMKAAAKMSINVRSWHADNQSTNDDDICLPCPAKQTSTQSANPSFGKQLFASVRSTSSPELMISQAGNQTGGQSSPPSRLSRASECVSKFYTKRRKTTQAKARERARLRGNVDIRLIDFAHTARVDAPRVANSEDDEGLLFGFDQLIKAISQLMDEQDMQQMS